MSELDDLRRRRAEAFELLRALKAGEINLKACDFANLASVTPEQIASTENEVAELDKDIAKAEAHGAD